MKIIACVKVVPDTEDITVTPDGKLSFDRAAATISSFDLNAIEAGARLAGEDGSFVTLSVGGPEIAASKMRKDILSRGPKEAFFVADEELAHADTGKTARALKAAISKIGEFDLVIAGDGSADMFAQQTGVQLGEMLGIPVVNGVNKIASFEDSVEVERLLDDCTEVLEVQLPAVLCVTSDINLPRIPTMKELLSAGKKPSTVWTAADLEDGLSATFEESDLVAPPNAERKNIIFQGESDEVIDSFIEAIRAEFK